MKKSLVLAAFAAAAVILGSTPVSAGPIRGAIQEFRANHGHGGCSTMTTTASVQAQAAPCGGCGGTTSVSATSSVALTQGGGLAQQKAEQAASRGFKGHVGGAINGTNEGTGFSTVSAQDAVQHCCYWGRLHASDIGVARGPDGWYACVQYGGAGPVRTLASGLVQTAGATIQSTGHVIQSIGQAVSGPTCKGPNCVQQYPGTVILR